MRKDYSNSEVEKIYDEHAKLYDFRMFFIEFFLRKLRRELISNIKGKVLEVSIGSGANLRYYPKNCEIVGIDLSKEMLELASKKALKYDTKVKLEKGNAEKLRFKGEEFDCVIDTLGLCTFPNPNKVLSEMKRVCKKNGRILLLEHGIGKHRLVNKFLNWRNHNHYRRLGCHLTRDIGKIVKNSGLKIIGEKRKIFGSIYYIIAKK